MPRPAPFRRPSYTPTAPPTVTVPVAFVRTPKNRWIQKIGETASYSDGECNVLRGTEETFTALLDAIEEHNVVAVEYALNDLGVMDDGHRGYLSWLCRIWLNEDDPVTADVLFQGLDLMCPEVLGLDDEAYRQDVLGMLHLVAAQDEDEEGPASYSMQSSESFLMKGSRLISWLTDLVAERPIDLALAPHDVQEKRVNSVTLRALAAHLEAVELRSSHQDEELDAARPRRRL